MALNVLFWSVPSVLRNWVVFEDVGNDEGNLVYWERGSFLTERIDWWDDRLDDKDFQDSHLRNTQWNAEFLSGSVATQIGRLVRQADKYSFLSPSFFSFYSPSSFSHFPASFTQEPGDKPSTYPQACLFLITLWFSMVVVIAALSDTKSMSQHNQNVLPIPYLMARVPFPVLQQNTATILAKLPDRSYQHIYMCQQQWCPAASSESPKVIPATPTQPNPGFPRRKCFIPVQETRSIGWSFTGHQRIRHELFVENAVRISHSRFHPFRRAGLIFLRLSWELLIDLILRKIGWHLIDILG